MNRRWGRATLAAGIGIIGAVAWGGAGCSPTKPTELVPGALSQIEVPHNLAGIKVVVLANGGPKFVQSYLAKNGSIFLPATLGIVAGSGGADTTVTVIIAGYNQQGVLGQEFNDNSVSQVSAVGATLPDGTLDPSAPRLRRGSIQTYVDQHTLFLPMSLSYSCWGNDCGDGTGSGNTCKANACSSDKTDPHTLADFDPSLVDGTQDCFSPSSCFSGASSAVAIDASKCLYEVPPSQTLGPGLNVRIIYQDLKIVTNSLTMKPFPEIVPTSEQEVLNEEPAGALAEGFAIPDPAKPTQFQLAPGLCNLVKAASSPPAGLNVGAKYHTISAVQVSTACPSKPPLEPFCASEQSTPAVSVDGGTSTNIVCNQPITLDPAPSAIYMVMDDSSIMSGAFGQDGYATAMGLALGTPTLRRTYAAFEFLDHQNECTATSTKYLTPIGTNQLDFTLANSAQSAIASFLLKPQFPDGSGDASMPTGDVAAGTFAPLYLQPAMRSDVGVFKHLADFAKSLNEPLNIGAAMFFVNRVPDSTGVADAGSGGMIPLGTDCSPALDTAGDHNAQAALEQEIIAANGLGLQTYFVVLNNGINGIQGTPLSYFQTIINDVKASNVNLPQPIDATQPKSNAAQVLASFSNTVTALGTCLYELPVGVDTNAQVAFTIPIVTPANSAAPATVPIPYNAACSGTAAGMQANGWNIDATGVGPGGASHLRVCGTSCSDLRQSVLLVSAVSLQKAGDAGAPPIPDVPVTVKMPCTDAGM